MADVSNDEATLVALFALSTPLKPVVEELRLVGVPLESIEVISPLPLQGIEVSRPPRMPLHRLTILGGLAGIGLGIFFTVGTALFYPLMTGGKPIVAPPVVGIIAFENMMLLAIVTTFVALVLRLRVTGRPGPRDPRIDDGAVALSIDMGARVARPAVVQTLLNEAGALKITSLVKEQTRPPGPVAAKPSGTDGIWLWLGCALAALCSLNACSQDMETQASYQSQEAPRRHSPPGSIPLQSRAAQPASTVIPADQRLAGQRVFQINCVPCHGPSGGGDGLVAGYLRDMPKNLQASHVQRRSADDLFAVVTEGKDSMPPFRGELSAAERWAVVAYVKTLRAPDNPTGPP
jgi:mono/diheme cytochrome c family protein